MEVFIRSLAEMKHVFVLEETNKYLKQERLTKFGNIKRLELGVIRKSWHGFLDLN